MGLRYRKLRPLAVQPLATTTCNSHLQLPLATTTQGLGVQQQGNKTSAVLTIECVLLLWNVFSYYRTCFLSIECVFYSSKVTRRGPCKGCRIFASSGTVARPWRALVEGRSRDDEFLLFLRLCCVLVSTDAFEASSSYDFFGGREGDRHKQRERDSRRPLVCRCLSFCSACPAQGTHCFVN